MLKEIFVSFELTTKIIIVLNVLHILAAILAIISDTMKGMMNKVELRNYLFVIAIGIILGGLVYAVVWLAWIYIVVFVIYLCSVIFMTLVD